MAGQLSPNPIKIAIAAGSLGLWGGIEKQVVALQNYLPRSEFEVLFCADRHSPVWPHVSGVIFGVAGEKSSSIQKIVQYRRALKKFEPDIIHAHFGPDYIPAAIAGRLARVKTIVMTRHMAIGWGPVKRIALNSLYDHFVGCSGSVQHQLLECGLPAKKLSVILGGIECEGNYERISQSQENLDRPPTAIYLGRLDRGKGIEVLIQAIARTSAIKLEIWGEGPLEEYLKSLVHELQLMDQCHFMGQTSNLDQVFCGKKMLIVASTVQEAFPTVIMEALSYGCPVIASNIGGIPEIIDDGNSGLLVSPKDPDALALRLNVLAADDMLYSKLSKNGLELVLSQFTAEKMAMRYAEFYRKII